MVLWPMMSYEMSVAGRTAVQKQRTTVTSPCYGFYPSWAPLSPADLAFSPGLNHRADPKSVFMLKPSEVIARTKSVHVPSLGQKIVHLGRRPMLVC